MKDEQQNDEHKGTSTGNVKDAEGEDEHEDNLNAHDANLYESVRKEYLNGVHTGDQTSLKETV